MTKNILLVATLLASATPFAISSAHAESGAIGSSAPQATVEEIVENADIEVEATAEDASATETEAGHEGDEEAHADHADGEEVHGDDVHDAEHADEDHAHDDEHDEHAEDDAHDDEEAHGDHADEEAHDAE